MAVSTLYIETANIRRRSVRARQLRAATVARPAAIADDSVAVDLTLAHLIFVEDLDAEVEQISSRGIETSERETLDNGFCKVIYRDLDGNDICFGGPSLGV